MPLSLQKKQMKTRVRFAPSPTGPLHIGGLRTALYNYLYAKKNNGTFILRIEDTDQKRLVAGSQNYILEALKWAGIEPDEGGDSGGDYGPYNQSERKELYAQYIEQLIEDGKAYYAFDSDEELQNLRTTANANGGAFLYGAHNRMQLKNSLSLDAEKTKEALASQSYVVRLKVMPGETVSVFDEVRGTVSVNSDTLDDKVLLKKDGLPTYHFANVVDDHLMAISCVIRGEEWLPSLPFHALLYRAFNWEPPQFVHLPLILKPSGKGKLSKRDGSQHGFPVFPMSWEASTGFKEEGFLPEGLVNYLALLGWSATTDQEVFSLADLVAQFSLVGLQKGGARFDYAKAKWINQQHLRLYSAEETLSRFNPFLLSLQNLAPKQQLEVVALIKDRVELLTDFDQETEPFVKTPEIDPAAAQKIAPKNPVAILEKAQEVIQESGLNGLKSILMDWAKEQEIAVGTLMQTLRIALVGRLAGPDLFAIMEIIEKDVTLNRIQLAIAYFKT